MGIKLREKQLKNGEVSFYLDIYHNKTRWYEFLEIHIQKNRPSANDQEKRKLAQEIRAKREHELIVEDNQLLDRRKKQACFVAFFEQYINEKTENALYKGTLVCLKKFAGKQQIPIGRINEDWIKDFTKFLLSKRSNNTTIRYLRTINGAINEAIRQKIITRNPYKDIPSHQKLKIKDIQRKAFTIEELQLLADTPCDIDKQIKQAFLFSAFSGLRWSDVNPLRWDEIIQKKIKGEEKYFIHFEQEKTEGIEYLPLSENAIDIYKERKAEAQTEETSPYIFPHIREPENSRTVYQKVQKSMKRWAKAAGIPKEHLHFHTARHSFATNVLEHCDDGDLYTVSKLLGHKSIASTQVYAQVRDKRKLSAVMSLPKINFSQLNQQVG
jgi:integrase